MLNSQDSILYNSLIINEFVEIRGIEPLTL